MLRKLVTPATMAALLAVGIPAVGLAQHREGGGGGRSFSGGGHGYSPGFSGGRSFASPRGFGGFEGRRGFDGDRGFHGRGFVAPRFYGGGYRGFYGGGLYFGAPGYYYDPYVYDPGYVYAPYSYGPAPAPQTCSPGYYDQYGNWIQNPNCYPPYN